MKHPKFVQFQVVVNDDEEDVYALDEHGELWILPYAQSLHEACWRVYDQFAGTGTEEEVAEFDKKITEEEMAR